MEGVRENSDFLLLWFDFVNVVFYFGVLIVIVVMVFFGSIVWDVLGGFGLFIVVVVYVLGLIIVG